jgi:hypothetical protein
MLLIPVNDSTTSNMVFSKVRSWSDLNEREKNNNNPVKSDILRTPSRCTCLSIFIYGFTKEKSCSNPVSLVRLLCLVCATFLLFGVSNLQICISPSDFHEILFLFFPFSKIALHPSTFYIPFQTNAFSLLLLLFYFFFFG